MDGEDLCPYIEGDANRSGATMFADNTLTPKEAVRLCALGSIAGGPIRYGALAGSVRHFTSRIMGPSLDLMGTSIELLRYEGLVESENGLGMEHDPLLSITEAGWRELRALLTAKLRPGSDLSKLVIALKFRFLHLLESDDQRAQVEMLAEASESELNRLLDLRQHHADDGGHLVAWLDHDIELVESRLAWLEAFAQRAR